MRKRYDKEFKAKVALEALKGEKTLQEWGTGSPEFLSRPKHAGRKHKGVCKVRALST